MVFHRPPLVCALASIAVGAATAPALTAQDGYRLPPQEIVDILDAPQAPGVNVSADGEWLILSHRSNMPSLADMSQPMLRIGGRRINPATNGPFNPSLTTGYSVMRVEDGSERRVELPHEDGWGGASISPDGQKFFMTRATSEGIELWLGDLETATARQINRVQLNAARGGACSWMRDSQQLLCHLVDPRRGRAPEKPMVPSGPIIQETSGRVGAIRTYQDLLKTPFDVVLYDYYMTSIPTLIDVGSGRTTQLASRGIYASFSPSPSGDYFLVRERVKPYSYLVPDGRFAEEISVVAADGDLVRELPGKPLQEATIVGGVPVGPRNIGWMTGRDHTLTYLEALDGGDPNADVEYRDRLMRLELAASPREVLHTEFRYAGLSISESGTGFLSEFDQPTRTRRLWRVPMDDPDAKELLWERNSEDRYGDPGTPLTMLNDDGHRFVRQDGDWIFLTGAGASDQGDRPFLDRFNLETGESERLWRAGTDSYETMVAVLDDDANRILTRYETRAEPPNFYVRDLESGQRTALTDFPDPHPQLSGIQKQFVTYERDDGVQLSATLLLPPDYVEGQRLPVVVWAYPREYSNADVAGQVRGNPNQFTRIGGYSHLFFLTQGYAVFDAATMPIVGGNLANDTYVEQLVASGQAAVDKLVDLGVGDRDRIGIGGHSYGAFMTANILAHSDAFRAGIARSGAYNRTLTPFGFQNERRTYWEAPEVYFNMSPFMAADQVNEPMLMIHGLADNNSGTFPIQSERMFAALEGHGATARLIMLENESHGYRARESVMHTLAEMVEWFDVYLKNAEPRRITF